MEIERKFLIHSLPVNYQQYPFHKIEQGYLSIDPVIRARKEDDEYYLTYKSRGLLSREEVNLPLTKESYEHLKKKSDGFLITKTRYLIPYLNHFTIELDIFEGVNSGLIIAEVEFSSEEEAMAFQIPDWFKKDVTTKPQYQNCNLSVSPQTGDVQ